MPLFFTDILDRYQLDKWAAEGPNRASLANVIFGGGFHTLNRWAIKTDSLFLGIFDMAVTEYEYLNMIWLLFQVLK